MLFNLMQNTSECSCVSGRWADKRKHFSPRINRWRTCDDDTKQQQQQKQRK